VNLVKPALCIGPLWMQATSGVVAWVGRVWSEDGVAVPENVVELALYYACTTVCSRSQRLIVASHLDYRSSDSSHACDASHGKWSTPGPDPEHVGGDREM
jgi:hypothetical protein